MFSLLNIWQISIDIEISVIIRWLAYYYTSIHIEISVNYYVEACRSE